MLHDRISRDSIPRDPISRWSRLVITLLFLVTICLLLWVLLGPAVVQAQEPLPGGAPVPGTSPTATPTLPAAPTAPVLPSVWYLLAAGLALLAPAGFVLLAVANLEAQNAWNTALGGLAAAGLAAFAYWAVGFALQFGGVGLVYPHTELRGLVWEWSPLSSEWGIGWGMAGLSGWFLSGSHVTALAYMLFLGHLPWVLLAAILPVMALRGRAPSTVTLILALLLGGVIYPLAGNWVQGGGWLNALGRNLELGHGFVDHGGAGSVHLVAAGFSLAALTVWSVRRSRRTPDEQLPPAHQPLLAVVGALLILGGTMGWQFANPLQVETVGEIGMLRGAVAGVLAAAGGSLFPLLYTWFVTGSGDPTLTARGFAAGVVAGLASGPFVQPGIAFVIGLVAGITVPFVSYVLDGRLRLHDRTGVVVSSGVPALIGLLLVGIFADGVAGSGWQATGTGSYLGVTGQGVSGMLVGAGYQPDFPGQLQAQVIGVAALGLWGFLAGLVVCVPLGLLFHALLHRQEAPARATHAAPHAAPAPAPPLSAAAQLEQRTEPFAAQRPAFALEAPRVTLEPPPADVQQFPHEGYWPEPAARAAPADPFQALESGATPGAAGSGADGAAAGTPPGELPAAVPQPQPGSSPLLRRRGTGSRPGTPS